MQDDGIYYARTVHPLMRINPASPLFRREIVLREAGAWDNVRTGADSEFLARLKLIFGRGAIYRVKAPLAFGSHRPNSLMTAAGTGYDQTGMSFTRLAYWEAWAHWHISEVRQGRNPRLSLDLIAERPFGVQASTEVPKADIERCLSIHKQSTMQ
jgi:hypothetical protein